eukprot:2389123-Prymnesium_polylepis.1
MEVWKRYVPIRNAWVVPIYLTTGTQKGTTAPSGQRAQIPLSSERKFSWECLGNRTEDRCVDGTGDYLSVLAST